MQALTSQNAGSCEEEMANKKMTVAGIAVSMAALASLGSPAHADSTFQEAKVCMREIGAVLRCFDSAAQYRETVGLQPRDVETLDISDCTSGWLCLWDNANYSGNIMVKVRYEGTHDLAPYRDRANSVYNRHGGPAQLIDVRSLQPDDTLTLGPGHSRADLGALSSRWNNRTDKVKLCDPTGC
jgi:hypothetical protein